MEQVGNTVVPTVDIVGRAGMVAEESIGVVRCFLMSGLLARRVVHSMGSVDQC